MRIIVPMAGIGSRLRPHTLTVPKPLTLIAGKPIVQRLVEDIVDVVDQKVQEIAFVIGPTFPKDTEEKLMKIAEGLNARGVVSIQNEALGTAHAIQCAKDSLQGPCVVAFADTLFQADFSLDEESDGAIWVNGSKQECQHQTHHLAPRIHSPIKALLYRPPNKNACHPFAS